MTENKPYHDAIELLKKLVATPSFSTSEENTAAVIETFFQSNFLLWTCYRQNNCNLLQPISIYNVET